MKGYGRIHAGYCQTNKFIRRNSSTIMAIGGCVSLVGAVVFAVKASPKAKVLLEEAENAKKEPLTKAEIVMVATPVYLPAITMCIFTMVLVLGADVFNRRQKASLIGAYTALQKTYKEHQEKVKEIFGEEANDVVRRAIAKTKLEECKTTDMKNDECWFCIPELDVEFKATQMEVVLAEYHFNRNFVLRGYADVKEMLEFFEAPAIPYGNSIGWSLDAGFIYGYQWVDFEHEKVGEKDGIELWQIRMPFSPTADYLETEWYT